jgi:hypothetical protein
MEQANSGDNLFVYLFSPLSAMVKLGDDDNNGHLLARCPVKGVVKSEDKKLTSLCASDQTRCNNRVYYMYCHQYVLHRTETLLCHGNLQ